MSCDIKRVLWGGREEGSVLKGVVVVIRGWSMQEKHTRAAPATAKAAEVDKQSEETLANC